MNVTAKKLVVAAAVATLHPPGRGCPGERREGGGEDRLVLLIDHRDRRPERWRRDPAR